MLRLGPGQLKVRLRRSEIDLSILQDAQRKLQLMTETTQFLTHTDTSTVHLCEVDINTSLLFILLFEVIIVLALLVHPGLLVLLVLGDEVAHVVGCLTELQLIHT